MNILHRIWTGVVASVAGIAVAVVVQIVLQMVMGLSIDHLTWIVGAFASMGFLLGLVIGPRTTKVEAEHIDRIK